MSRLEDIVREQDCIDERHSRMHSENKKRIAELEEELKTLKGIMNDAPFGYEWVPVLVPVEHENQEKFIDGRSMEILDSAKIRGYIRENEHLKELLEYQSDAVDKAINILDGNEEPIDWREGGHELLRKLCEHLEAWEETKNKIDDLK